jgi:hypothetical protein
MVSSQRATSRSLRTPVPTMQKIPRNRQSTRIVDDGARIARKVPSLNAPLPQELAVSNRAKDK